MKTKTCNKCNKEKSFNEFLADKRNADGKQGICTDCRNAAKKINRDQRQSGAISTVTVESKVCNKCNKLKTIGSFFKDSGCSDGHATMCKECKVQMTTKWRDENREQYNAAMRTYNKKNYHKNRLNRYKLSVEKHQEMLQEQANKCAICEASPPEGKPLVIDHHHDTGKVRGLLCYVCNRNVVVLDDPEILKKTLAYMAKHE